MEIYINNKKIDWDHKMMIIVRVNRKYFSDFVERNDKFIKKVNKYSR